MAHRLLGTQIKYKARSKDEYVDAFVAAIEDGKGFTLHVLDVEEGLRLNICNRLGECWCINMGDKGMHPRWRTPQIWDAMMNAIESGVFDGEPIYEAAGVSVNHVGCGVTCAFG